MSWDRYLDLLIVWAANKGYAVEMSSNSDDCICEITKLIEINSSRPLETQVIRLLHECGHVLIFENGSVYDFEDKKKYDKHTVGYKVFTVIEEAEAWRRGGELAKRLKIPIEDDVWEKAMVKALKKYINWAAKGAKDEDED